MPKQGSQGGQDGKGGRRVKVKVLETQVGWDGLKGAAFVKLEGAGDSALVTVIGAPVKRKEFSDRYGQERWRVFFTVTVGDPAKGSVVPMILALPITQAVKLSAAVGNGERAGKVLVKVERKGKGKGTTYDSTVERDLDPKEQKKCAEAMNIELEKYLSGLGESSSEE